MGCGYPLTIFSIIDVKYYHLFSELFFVVVVLWKFSIFTAEKKKKK